MYRNIPIMTFKTNVNYSVVLVVYSYIKSEQYFKYSVFLLLTHILNVNSTLTIRYSCC